MATMAADSSTASPKRLGVRLKKGICASTPRPWLAPMNVAKRGMLGAFAQVAQYTAPPATPIRKNATTPAAISSATVVPVAT